MTGDNVQHWVDVADLPWREAFNMSTPKRRPRRRIIPTSRTTDTRSLADVVADIAIEPAA